MQVETLSSHIEGIRKKLGITQVDIAKVMGVNPKTYAIRIKECGDDFSIKEIKKLYEFMKENKFKENTYIQTIAKASMLSDDILTCKNEYTLSISSDDSGAINLQIKKA